MSAPWAEDVTFLPPFGQRLSDKLHGLGFMLDSTRFQYAFFGCRDVRFTHQDTGLWVRLFFDGKEGQWLTFMSMRDDNAEPDYWLPAGNWLRWVGLVSRSMRDDQLNDVLADDVGVVVERAKVSPVSEVMSAVGRSN